MFSNLSCKTLPQTYVLRVGDLPLWIKSRSLIWIWIPINLINLNQPYNISNHITCRNNSILILSEISIFNQKSFFINSFDKNDNYWFCIDILSKTVILIHNAIWPLILVKISISPLYGAILEYFKSYCHSALSSESKLLQTWLIN